MLMTWSRGPQAVFLSLIVTARIKPKDSHLHLHQNHLGSFVKHSCPAPTMNSIGVILVFFKRSLCHFKM